MPLKLQDPIAGRTSNYTIRGTHLGVRIHESARTSDKRLAKRRLAQIKEEIERGEFGKASAEGTFVAGAVRYMQGGGEKRYLQPLIDHFGSKQMTGIKQADVDEAAGLLYPPGPTHQASPHNAHLNRVVYTPVSAVLRANDIAIVLRRPKEKKGKLVYLTVEQAKEWLTTAPPKLANISLFLLYSGARSCEAINLRVRDVSLEHATAQLHQTKNDTYRGVHLTPMLIAMLAPLVQGRDPNEPVFGYHHRKTLHTHWAKHKKAIDFPEWFTPHICRYTWATWMRQFAGLDLQGLKGTGAWSSIASVERYSQVVPTVEARRVEDLPVIAGPTLVASGGKKAGAR